MILNPPDSLADGTLVSVTQGQPPASIRLGPASLRVARRLCREHSTTGQHSLELLDSIALSLVLLPRSLFVAGCRPVGPNYNRPPVDTPTAWKEQPPEGWKNATPSDDIAKGNWWEIFGDPQLNDLGNPGHRRQPEPEGRRRNVSSKRAPSATATRSNFSVCRARRLR